MKSAQVRRALPVAAIALTALAGCSKNVPCPTDPSQIEGARAEAQSAARQVETAKAELTSAEQRKAEVAQKLSSIPDKNALAAKLEELKKGSGR